MTRRDARSEAQAPGKAGPWRFYFRGLPNPTELRSVGFSVASTAVTIHSQRTSTVYGPGAGVIIPSGFTISSIASQTPTSDVSPSTRPTNVHCPSDRLGPALGRSKSNRALASLMVAMRYLPVRSIYSRSLPETRGTTAAQPRQKLDSGGLPCWRRRHCIARTSRSAAWSASGGAKCGPSVTGDPNRVKNPGVRRASTARRSC